MIKSNEQNKSDDLIEGEQRDFLYHSMLYVSTKTDGCTLEIKTSRQSTVFSIEALQQGVLLLAPGSINIISGELRCVTLNFMQLAKLQAFLDRADNKKEITYHNASWSYVAVDWNDVPSMREVEYWFLDRYFQDSHDISTFSNVLRRNEWYGLVDFLLREFCDGASNQRLQELCSRYGLSVAHFRRLARYALGNTAKVELRDWRLAGALLELSEGKNSITTVAMNHGYSSLSHFSNEAKVVLGVSPRNIKKILNKS